MSFLRSVALLVDSRHPEKIVGIGRAWTLSLTFSALALALFLLHPYYLAALGHFLIASDQFDKADAIVVLAGGSSRDERLLHAVYLWQNGYAPVVVLSAMLADWQSHEDFPSWRHAKNLRLLPDNSLLVALHDADSTRAEAEALLPFVQEHRYRSVILVTSNFHTRRAKMTYQGEWTRSGIAFWISAAPTSDFHPDDWWTRRKDSKVFFYEFSKTIWYGLFE